MKKEYAIKITGVITIDDMEPEQELKHQFGRKSKKKKEMRKDGIAQADHIKQ